MRSRALFGALAIAGIVVAVSVGGGPASAAAPLLGTPGVFATLSSSDEPVGAAVAADGTVYVSRYWAGDVVAFAPDGTREPGLDIPDLTYPTQLAIHGDTMYVGMGSRVAAQGGVAVVDLSDPEHPVVSRPAYLQGGGFGVAVSPDGSTLYVTGLQPQVVTVVDLATQTTSVVRDDGWTLDLPLSEALSPDGGTLYVLDGISHAIFVVSTATNDVTGFVSTASAGALGMATSPDGSLLYVADDSSISAVDTSTGTTIDAAATSGDPGLLAVSPDGSKIYAPRADGNIFEIPVLLPPAITRISAATGVVAGGASVTISGDYLSTATAVSFGNTPASSFSVNSNGTLTAVAPAGTLGTVDITVTTPQGTSPTTAADQFTYTAVVTPPPDDPAPANQITTGDTSTAVLADTGNNLTAPASTAALLLIAGMILLALRRHPARRH